MAAPTAPVRIRPKPSSQCSCQPQKISGVVPTRVRIKKMHQSHQRRNRKPSRTQCSRIRPSGVSYGTAHLLAKNGEEGGGQSRCTQVPHTCNLLISCSAVFSCLFKHLHGTFCVELKCARHAFANHDAEIASRRFFRDVQPEGIQKGRFVEDGIHLSCVHLLRNLLVQGVGGLPIQVANRIQPDDVIVGGDNQVIFVLKLPKLAIVNDR